MTHLIVCCDGTWNTPDQEDNGRPAPTNVVRLYNALAAETPVGVAQDTYYHPGVGTDGSLLERSTGGMYGAGLSKNIISSYVWLAQRYQPGDLIFLFGFSRGAFTVRSLAGFLSCCGLLDLSNCLPSDTFARAQCAYDEGYRNRKANWRPNDWGVRAQPGIPIHFIGVWDTVGALGIPDDMALLNLFDKPEKWRFHDTRLSNNVSHARQALAIDEWRASFTPTLWTDDSGAPLGNDDKVQQLWFPGVHSDIGGSYYECGLSDVALQWMIDEAQVKGLAFDPLMVNQLKPDPLGVMHDSVRGVYKALRTRPRNIPCFDDAARFHPSAITRNKMPPIAQAPYHDTVRLAPQQTSHPFAIYAREHWNATGLYLEQGATYEFTAQGEWLDRTIPSGPQGMNDGEFHLGELIHTAGSLLGGIEKLFKKVTGNERADFWGTRRIESMPWFALVGIIANDSSTGSGVLTNDGSPHPHQMFLIGNSNTLQVQKSGYFYAFANDAWGFYENNRGSVSVTVKRV